jgi:hypothetical protein
MTGVVATTQAFVGFAVYIPAVDTAVVTAVVTGFDVGFIADFVTGFTVFTAFVTGFAAFTDCATFATFATFTAFVPSVGFAGFRGGALRETSSFMLRERKAKVAAAGVKGGRSLTIKIFVVVVGQRMRG